MDELLLPAATRLIHVGPKKTGTTALQDALHRARADLGEHGVCYPGPGRRARDAVWAVVTHGRAKPRHAGGEADPWGALVRTVEEAGDQRVCLSDEKLADAGPKVAEQIVDELGGDRTHIVIVVRRLDRLLPSQWQQRVQAGETASYDEWLRVVLGPKPQVKGRERQVWLNFWQQHDLPDLVDRFGRHVGRARLTLVIADESDRDLLPRTFERFLGLPVGTIEMRTKRSNRSLSLNEVELVRHVNLHYGDRELPPDRWRSMVSSGMIAELKGSPRKPDDLPITTPDWAADQVAELSAARVKFVESAGWRVVGDASNLRAPVPGTAEESTVGAHGDAALVSTDVAADAVCATIEAAIRSRRRARRTRANA